MKNRFPEKISGNGQASMGNDEEYCEKGGYLRLAVSNGYTELCTSRYIPTSLR